CARRDRRTTVRAGLRPAPSRRTHRAAGSPSPVQVQESALCSAFIVGLTVGISRRGAHSCTRRGRLHAELGRPSIPGWPPARSLPRLTLPPCSHGHGARETWLATLGTRPE